MSKDSFDKKDQALLKALKKNARASLVSLARDIDLSRSATHDRITKLEEAGVIKRYTIDIDETAMPFIRAFLTVSYLPNAAPKDIVHRVHQMHGVEAAHCITGDIDMIIYAECDTMDELADIRDQVAAFEGVTAITTRQILSTAQS